MFKDYNSFPNLKFNVRKVNLGTHKYISLIYIPGLLEWNVVESMTLAWKGGSI